MSPVIFDAFAPGSAEVLVLFGARVGGMVLVAPVLSENIIPRQVRVALLLVLTVLMQPVALASAHGIPALTPAAFLSETLIGFAIGFGAAVFIAAAETAGDVMSIQIGLSGAAIMDPTNHSQIPVLGSLVRTLTIVVLLSLDLHTVMLSALADSTTALPVGVPITMAAGAQSLILEAGAMFAIGVKLAAPVMAAVLIANVAIAVLGRAAPQLNILSVSFPIQIAVGMLALIASLPAIARVLGGWAGSYDQSLGVVVRAFAALPSR